MINELKALKDMTIITTYSVEDERKAFYEALAECTKGIASARQKRDTALSGDLSSLKEEDRQARLRLADDANSVIDFLVGEIALIKKELKKLK